MELVGRLFTSCAYYPDACTARPPRYEIPIHDPSLSRFAWYAYRTQPWSSFSSLRWSDSTAHHVYNRSQAFPNTSLQSDGITSKA